MITAAAHKLTCQIYMMLTRGEQYIDQGQDYFEESYRQRVLHQRAKRAEKLGMKLTTMEATACEVTTEQSPIVCFLRVPGIYRGSVGTTFARETIPNGEWRTE